MIDSQSVKTMEAGGPRGFDACKKIKGRKRHIITDTQGHLVALRVHPADIQDRDGAVKVLTSIRALYPWLRHVFADGGYAGDKLRDAVTALGRWTIEIIKRSDAVKGFAVLNRRWVVERTFGWLGLASEEWRALLQPRRISMPHARFTKEFRDEAVRLALTSGRSRREVAAGLGSACRPCATGSTGTASTRSTIHRKTAKRAWPPS
ncbi:hypothetical protein MAE02_58980 [Microvirga aerophila]|uniref:Transposase IS4-like domain-containing protein n=1 Tax=Microvirga aerophila TaxID=670291 RepID=A0A512C1W0_9HYPH|nr:hypothetical protein MAE02_58980 [Microvirga aerophila]